MKLFYSLIIAACMMAPQSFGDYIITHVEPQEVFTSSNQQIVGISHDNGSIYLIKDGQVVQEIKPKYSLAQKVWHGLKWGLIMRFGLCLLPLKDDASDFIACIYGAACAASLQ